MTFYDHDHSEAGAEESCGKLYDAHRTSVQSRNRVSIMSWLQLVPGEFCAWALMWMHLSGHVPEIQAEVEVVKIKNPDFSCWAWSTPWGHVLSLKSFCWNPVLSWAIRYSVFQPVKFSSSFEFVCRTIFSTFWHLVVKFGYNKWFLSNKKVVFFRFGEICMVK